MTALDPKLALSAVEAESLRQLRTRLNKPATSDAARLVLGKVWLETIARVGITPAEPAGAQPTVPQALIEAAHAADMGGLRLLTGRLAAIRTGDPKAWGQSLAAGAPQAIVSRRLALAGREPSKAPHEAA